MNYYEILGISIDADAKEIRGSYKKKASIYHPDVCKFDKVICNDKMTEINLAYETLSNNVLRSEYDEMLHYQDLSGLGDIYRSFDEDLYLQEDVMEGTVIIGEDFDGEEFKVKVPHYLGVGEFKLRVKGRGESLPDGTRGDLYIIINVIDDHEHEIIDEDEFTYEEGYESLSAFGKFMEFCDDKGDDFKDGLELVGDKTSDILSGVVENLFMLFFYGISGFFILMMIIETIMEF